MDGFPESYAHGPIIGDPDEASIGNHGPIIGDPDEASIGKPMWTPVPDARAELSAAKDAKI
eukprot:3983585-Prymnesium_polylepis.1